MAQAARLNLRMQKELQLLLTDPPPRASFPLLSSNSEYSSLSTIDAEIEGPEGTVYANGIFKIRIQIPERYPFQPPSVTFATPVYHPNIDNGGRICLDILNLPPKGAWQPSLNISTVLTSIGLLLSEPNPDDGLMCDASREFKYNRQVFDQKARSMTEKYAKAGAIGNSCPSQAFQNSSNLGMIELRGSEECKLKASESISSHKKPCKITQEVPMETSSSSQVGDIGREMKKVHNEVQMEATGKRKQANVALDYSNMIDEMHATRRKLALGFSYKSQQKEGHCKENVMPNQNSASCLQLPVYSSESTNVTYPSKDVIERVGNCGIDVKSNKRCMVGKKLSLGPKCSSRGEETDNKENVAPIPKQPLSSLKSSFTESEIGQKLCLSPLTQLTGRGENNSHCPCEVKSIHTENKCNEMKKFNKDCGGKIVAESEQEKVEESLISEEAIVLDSEDSEDEKDGISRCRLSFVQKRMGKWRFKA